MKLNFQYTVHDWFHSRILPEDIGCSIEHHNIIGCDIQLNSNKHCHFHVEGKQAIEIEISQPLVYHFVEYHTEVSHSILRPLHELTDCLNGSRSNLDTVFRSYFVSAVPSRTRKACLANQPRINHATLPSIMHDFKPIVVCRLFNSLGMKASLNIPMNRGASAVCRVPWRNGYIPRSPPLL